MSRELEAAFHASLERLLRGETTLDECVADHQQHADDLRQLLVIALDLQALAPTSMDISVLERGARLIDEELDRFNARTVAQSLPRGTWQRLTEAIPRLMQARVVGLATAFAVAIVAYGGVTLAAVNSGPESALYGYRLTLEDLRIGFAQGEEKAYLYLDTAEQRMREIETSVGVGDAGAAARASSAYQDVVRKGMDVLDAAGRDATEGDRRSDGAAADYQRRLADHEKRFVALTDVAIVEAVREPVAQARRSVRSGLVSIIRRPTVVAQVTATPVPTPPLSNEGTPTPVAETPVPTTPVAETPAPTTPVAETSAPTTEGTPTPVADLDRTFHPAPIATTARTETPRASVLPRTVTPVDVVGSVVVVTGVLNRAALDRLVVSGIPIVREGFPLIDAIPLEMRVRAEAVVAADGRLRLVRFAPVEPAPTTPVAETPVPTTEGTPTPVAETPAPSTSSVPSAELSLPTIQGLLVSLDAFAVRVGGMVLSRPLDTPLLLDDSVVPGDEVIVAFEPFRASSSYVLVARRVTGLSPFTAPTGMRIQGVVELIEPEALTVNGVRVGRGALEPLSEVGGLVVGALVEVNVENTTGAIQASAIRLITPRGLRVFANLASFSSG